MLAMSCTDDAAVAKLDFRCRESRVVSTNRLSRGAAATHGLTRKLSFDLTSGFCSPIVFSQMSAATGNAHSRSKNTVQERQSWDIMLDECDLGHSTNILTAMLREGLVLQTNATLSGEDASANSVERPEVRKEISSTGDDFFVDFDRTSGRRPRHRFYNCRSIDTRETSRTARSRFIQQCFRLS